MQSSDIILILLVLGACYIVWQIIGGGGTRGQMQKRIKQLNNRKTKNVKTADAQMSLRRKTSETKGLISVLTKPLPNFKRLGDKLDRAGVKITPKQYALRLLLVMMVVTFIVFYWKKSFILGISAGIVIGIWLPLKFLQRAINKQNKAFLLLFPDALDLIVRGLRSGLPVSESLVLVSDEVADPVGSTFRHVSHTMKLGVSLEKALQEAAKKLGLTEFNFFTTSIVMQRETGGNLSEILNNLIEVLRGRTMMQMKIKAMSSEARASSMIIGALPFVVITLLMVVSPKYLMPLYDDPRGNVAAGIAAFMMIAGIWIMNRMAKFEI